MEGWMDDFIEVSKVLSVNQLWTTIYTLVVFKIKAAFITTERTASECALRESPANCRVWPAGQCRFPHGLISTRVTITC